MVESSAARKSCLLDGKSEMKSLSRHVAVVVPVYNESENVDRVIEGIPRNFQTIVVVDDASTDDSLGRIHSLAESDSRVHVCEHNTNQGVGGAVVTGLRHAVSVGADIVVKMDGDGQMSPEDLATLIEPLLNDVADYTKGNRFSDLKRLKQMPVNRLIGNVALSFLTKLCVGYWNCADPVNGFIAIRREALAKLRLDSLSKRFFFETSLLAELYLARAVVQDVAIPARYGNEASHLRTWQVLFEFPIKLFACFIRRIIIRHFLFDFSMGGVYFLFGAPLLIGGLIYGVSNWAKYSQLGVGAPTGTVVIAAMAIILGVQFLLSAIGVDIQSVPSRPISSTKLHTR